MTKQFSTEAAFKSALEARLRKRGQEQGVPFAIPDQIPVSSRSCPQMKPTLAESGRMICVAARC